jgi:hypothetical protein
MKVTLSNLTDSYLQDYKLRKKFDNNFSVKEIDNTVIYQGDDFKYLVESTAVGLYNETGTISKLCKDYEFELDVNIKHIEGKFNMKNCIAEKKVILNNPLDCIIDKKLNIFDFAATVTNTIQGTIYRQNYIVEKTIRFDNLIHDGFGSVTNKTTLNEILDILGGVPDSSSFGFYPEYGYVSMVPIVITENDASYGTYESYRGHRLILYIVYVQLWSAVQESIYWKPAALGGYYFPLNQPLIFSNENYIETIVFDLFSNATYQNSTWQIGSGDNQKYIKTDISNTYEINPIIEQMFECTGLQVISNFFGINADNINPKNEYYDWALSFASNIKIVQSFDIIRESALKDSFSQSGLFEVKKLLKDLCLLFNLIISQKDTKIYIEHKSFYTGKAIDLTDKDYEFGELQINRDLIDIEMFQYAQNFNNEAHYQAELVYNKQNLYAQENIKNFKTEILVTDVFTSLNKEEFNKDEYKKLFFLLLTNGSSIIGLNQELSFDNIVKKLHDLDRPLKKAKINNIDHEFLKYSIGLGGEIKIMSSLQMFDLLEPFTSVVTDYGTFVIEEFDIDQDNLMTFKIKK